MLQRRQQPGGVRRIQRQPRPRRVAVRSMVALVRARVNKAEREAGLQCRQARRRPSGALLHPQRRVPRRAPVVHHQRQMRGNHTARRQPRAGAEQVPAQQRGVFEHALGHERVRARLELQVNQQGCAGTLASSRLEGRPPRHVLPARPAVVGHMLGGQPLQPVEVELVHPVLAEQAEQIRHHARMGKQPFVRRVALRRRRTRRLLGECHARQSAPDAPPLGTAIG